MNKTTSKKIKFIVSICLVAIIISMGVIALIMGIVPVGKNGRINMPDEVYIYSSWYSNRYPSGMLRLRRGDGETDETEKVNNIYNYLNEGFKQKALTALFRGQLGKGIEYKYNETYIANKYKDDEEKITIMFVYSRNNKQLADENNLTSDYRYVCFTVSNTSKWQEVVFALGTDYSDLEDESSKSTYTGSSQFIGHMNTLNLYNYAYSLIVGERDN